MIRPDRTKSRRGMMLFELMVALMLLGAFMFVATNVLRGSMRASYEARTAADLGGRFENAVSQLRRDVWSAASIERVDERILRITTPQDTIITWTADQNGAFLRADASSQRNWPRVAAGMRFHLDGPVLLLAETGPGTDPARRIPIVSQIALAKGDQS